MSWRDIMQRLLPPTSGMSPEITSPYGAVKGRTPPATIPHRGIDFNYPIGQAGINLMNPELRSPVAGVVTTDPGEGSFGRIAIRDANGLSHEILHTHTQHVKRGDLIGVGQLIGTMGNTGTGQHHVHYQLKDSAGRPISPTKYWDELGLSKADPGQPAYLREYQQYLRSTGANVGNGSGDTPDMISTPAIGSLSMPSDELASRYATENFRYLGRHNTGKLASPVVFGPGTPAVPYVPSNTVLAPDRKNTFSDRFGNWTVPPVAPSNESRSPDSENFFDSRFGN